jgi:hypothetical protein
MVLQLSVTTTKMKCTDTNGHVLVLPVVLQPCPLPVVPPTLKMKRRFLQKEKDLFAPSTVLPPCLV